MQPAASRPSLRRVDIPRVLAYRYVRRPPDLYVVSPVTSQTSQTKNAPRTFEPDPPRRRRHLVRAAAFFAVAMLAALAVHGVYHFHLIGGGDDSALHGSASESAEGYDPDEVVEAFTAMAAQIRRDAQGDVDGLIGQAQGDVDSALNQAELEVRAAHDHALSAAMGAAGRTGSLPDVPDDYLPGVPVTPDMATSIVYEVPGYGQIGIADLDALEAAWEAGSSGITGPESPLPGEVGGAQEDVGEQLDDLFADPVMQPVWVITGMAGVPAEPLLKDAAAGGTSDLHGALEPDEEGALLAKEHAGDILARGDQVVVILQEAVDTIEAQQTELVGVVEASVEETMEKAVEHDVKVREQLEADVERVLEDAVAEQERVRAAAKAYLDQVEDVRDDATMRLETTLDTQSEAVDAAAKEAAARLLREADEVTLRAEGLLARVDAEAEASLARLQALQDQGADVEAQMESVRTAAAQTAEDVAMQAEADVEELVAKAESLASYAGAQVANLESMVAGLEGDLEAMAAAAVEHAETARAYGEALAIGRAEVLVEAHTEAAQEAVAEVQATAEAHVQDIVDKAVQLNRFSYDVVVGAEVVADAIKDAAELYVQEDLEYILTVAEDYAARGPADVDKKAEEWLEVHDALAVLQDDLMIQGFLTAQDAGGLTALIDEVHTDLLAFGFL